MSYRCLGDDTLRFTRELVKVVVGDAAGSVGEALQVHVPQGHISTLIGKAKSTQLVSILLASSNALLPLIPALYQLADQSLPCVFHVFAGSVNTDLSYSLNYDHIAASRNTGLVFLNSHTVVEGHHLALIAHAAARRAGVPVLHFFDTAYKNSCTGASSWKVNPAVVKKAMDDAAEVKGQADAAAAAEQAEVENADGVVVEKKKGDSNLYFRNGTAVHSQSYTDLPVVIDGVMKSLAPYLGHRYQLYEFSGPTDATHAIVSLGSACVHIEETIATMRDQQQKSPIIDKIGVVKVRLYRPWSDKLFLQAIPPSVTHITVLDHSTSEIKAAVNSRSAGNDEFGPLFLDVVSAVQQLKPVARPIVSTARYSANTVRDEVMSAMLGQSVSTSLGSPSFLSAGHVPAKNTDFTTTTQIVRPESAYIKMLNQAFDERLNISNALGAASVWGNDQSRQSQHGRDRKHSQQGGALSDYSSGSYEYGDVEYGYGVLLSLIQRRKQLISQVSKAVADPSVPLADELRDAMQGWLSKTEGVEEGQRLAEEIAHAQATASFGANHPFLQSLARNPASFRKTSQWLVGGSNWAYDLSYSGIHHVISSGQNVNLLIVETEPYSQKETDKNNPNWKKDIGLYAMNYGGAYVASVAMYSSYSQTMCAMMEADKFEGPSIILAYAPDTSKLAPNDANNASGTDRLAYSEAQQAIDMLKETKMAVSDGKWPLYRWNPANTDTPFILDSQYAKRELVDFLKRENHLSMLCSKVPEVHKSLSSTLDSEFKIKHEAQQKEAQEAYLKLVKGLGASKPVLIMFGSDGGNAEGLAKRLEAEGNARGLDCRAIVMDDCSLGDLKDEEYVVAVVSTAGQGEFPTNARGFWHSLKSDSGPGMLTTTKFTVFSLGDSHYWPRPEEKHFFAKAGKDLDEKLAAIGGERILAIGLGDDQDDDGYETAFAQWEPKLWNLLGVGGGPSRSKLVKVQDDQIKGESNYLRGTILEALADESTGSIPFLDTKLTKFHGIYMQDDRDLREARKAQELERAFSFMIRICVPGGVCTPEQYLAMEALGETAGNGGLKLTTRQAFQLHGVIKRNLKQTIQDINRALMDTLAACGDVCRNVMASALAPNTKVHKEVLDFARRIQAHLRPRTTAYHEIWLDKKKVSGTEDHEPLYGPTYLPRKFKVAIAIPPHNDIDVFGQGCLGYIAIVNDKTQKLEGFNVVIGGGMGTTHNNTKTYPCLAQPLGFCTVDQAVIVGEKVMLVQRDYGDRENRKHARLKYTLRDHGMEWFREQVEERAGFKMQPSRAYKFTDNTDVMGWRQTDDGMWHFTLFVEHGRIKDTPEYPLKTGLREIARIHNGDFRLTGSSNMIIGNVLEENKPLIEQMLVKYKISNNRHTGLRLNSMACAALPYCALSMAEAERYLPTLIDKLDDAIEEAGLRDRSIMIRMTGCPNGCARPFLAEIGFVGKAPGRYNLYLGGGHAGERLNKCYKENQTEEEILAELTPMLHRYAKERSDGEPFGDYVIRAGIIKATVDGPDFHSK